MKHVDSLWLDLRMAARWLLKNRGATALAVFSIALGIGLTTSLFSVADAVLFRPYPFRQPGELHVVRSTADDNRPIGYGWLDYQDMARASADVGEMAAVSRHALLLAGDLSSELVLSYSVSRNFFTLLGASAELGRADVNATGDGRPQVVLSHRLWMRRFGSDPNIVGQTAVFNGLPCVVSGVMPPWFGGIIRGVPCDVFIGAEAFATRSDPRSLQSRNGQLELLLRLHPGTPLEPTAARLDAAIRGAGAHPSAPPGVPGTQLVPAFVLSWPDKLEYGGGVLTGLVLLLFVACANAAQLRLAQAESRRKEMGVRLALGSGSWRLARLLLIETLLASLAGAAIGLYFTDSALKLANRVVAGAFGFLDYGFTIDWRVGAFTFAATLGASLLAGLSPAHHALRLDVLEILKSEEGTARTKLRLQRTLIAGQTAASVVFFGSALLFTISFHHAAATWPGFDPAKSMVLLPAVPGLRLPRATWSDQACERLRGLAGVRDATYARRIPLSVMGGSSRSRVELPNQPPLAVGVNSVASNYFAVMRPRVIAGRGIDGTDRESATLVAVVSQQLARRIAGERHPVGDWVKIEGKPRQIVGIVEDAPSSDLHETPEPCVYLPFAQYPRGDITLLVETSGDAAASVRSIQQELKRFDPGITLYDVTTLERHMDRALFVDRTAAWASTGMGALGFALTAAGLFGLVQYSVSRRTREIGVRIALGAAPRQIQLAVLRESLRTVVPGIGLGLVLLGAGAWWLRSFLLGVSYLDPFAYVACALAAAFVSLLAAWLPAHRATTINPVEALRAE